MGLAGAAAAAGVAVSAGTAIANSGGGSSGTPNAGASGSTQTTTASAPWSGYQPSLTTALQGANYLYQGQQPQYYPDSTVSPLNDYQQGALSNLYNTGTNGTADFQAGQGSLYNAINGGNLASTQPAFYNGQSTLEGMTGGSLMNGTPAAAAYDASQGSLYNLGSGSALTPAMQTASSGQSGLQSVLGAGLDPSSNPYLQQAQQNTLAQAIPAAESGFNAGGRMDSGLASRAASMGATDALGQLNYGQYNQNVQNTLGAASGANNALSTALSGTLGATGQTANEYGTNLSGTLNANSLASNNYNTQTGQQLTATGMSPTFNEASLSGLGAALGAGSTAQTQSQAELTADQQRWNYNQQLPFSALSQYEQYLQGSGATGYATQTQTSPYFQNTLGNALTGGVAGASLGNALSNSSVGNSLSSLFGGKPAAATADTGWYDTTPTDTSWTDTTGTS